MSPVPAIARWSVTLLGAQSSQFVSSTQSWHVLSALCLRLQGGLWICWEHSQFVSSTQSWHVWLPCACNCKVVCVFTGSKVMSICKFYSIMTCLIALCLRLQGGLCLYWEHSHVNLSVLLNHDMSDCPVPAIARWSVSLLGAQSCQFVSSTQSWHVLSALCLRLQGGLCLCLVQSHVNL